MRILLAVSAAVLVWSIGAILFDLIPRTRPRRRRASRLTAWLLQTGSRLSVRQFIVAVVILSLGVGVIVTAATGAPALGFVVVFATALGIAVAFAKRRERRRRQLAEAWPEGLREIKGLVKSGSTISSAVAGVAERGPEPIRELFDGWTDRVRMLGVTETLEAIRDEAADITTDRVIEMLIIAETEGGDLVDTLLDELVEEVSADLRQFAELEAEGTGTRIDMAAMLVGSWAILVLLLLGRPDVFGDYYRSPAGQFVILVAAIWSLISLGIMRAIAQQQTEPRVLGTERDR